MISGIEMQVISFIHSTWSLSQKVVQGFSRWNECQCKAYLLSTISSFFTKNKNVTIFRDLLPAFPPPLDLHDVLEFQVILALDLNNGQHAIFECFGVHPKSCLLPPQDEVRRPTSFHTVVGGILLGSSGRKKCADSALTFFEGGIPSSCVQHVLIGFYVHSSACFWQISKQLQHSCHTSFPLSFPGT